METKHLKRLISEDKPGYIKYGHDDYNHVLFLFNILQGQSKKRLYINREMLRAFAVYVKGEMLK